MQRICLDMRTGAGCGTHNPNHAHLCSKCGKALRFALALHDPKTRVGRYRVARFMDEWDIGSHHASPISQCHSVEEER